MVSWSPGGALLLLLLTLTLLAAASATTTASAAVLTSVPSISSASPLSAVSAAATTDCCHLRLVLGCESREGFVEVGCSGAGSCTFHGYCCHGHLFGGHIHFVSSFHHSFVAGCRKFHVADMGSDIHWEGHGPDGFSVTGATTTGKLSRLFANFVHYQKSLL